MTMKRDKTAKAPIEWLLEASDVGVRYLAMRDLTVTDKKGLMAAKKLAHTEGPLCPEFLGL